MFLHSDADGLPFRRFPPQRAALPISGPPSCRTDVPVGEHGTRKVALASPASGQGTDADQPRRIATENRSLPPERGGDRASKYER